MADQHFLHSVLRDRTIEHLLIGRLLQRLWCNGNTNVEILRSEFDRGGYDLVADAGAIVRHIQLKCSKTQAAAAGQKISLNLSQKPSGCVLWIVVDEELNFDHFLWFGGLPGEPLPDILRMPVAKHVKANAQGIKSERANLRIVSKGKFARLETLDDVLDRLFGSGWRSSNTDAIDCPSCEPATQIETHDPNMEGKKVLSLDDLLARVTPENLHGPIDWGPPVGKEVW